MKAPAAKLPTKPTHRTMQQYVKALARADCLICQLPRAVQAQLVGNRNRTTYPKAVVVAWLRAEWDDQITTEIYEQHHRHKHAAQ